MRKEIQITICMPNGNHESFLACRGNTLASALILEGWKFYPKSQDRRMDNTWKMKIEEDKPIVSIQERKKLTRDELEKGIRCADLYSIDHPIQVYLNEDYIKENMWDNISWSTLAKEVPLDFLHIYLPGRQVSLPGAFQEANQTLYDRIVTALKEYQILLNPQELRELAFLDRLGRPVIEIQALVNKETREVYSLTRKTYPLVGFILSLEMETVTLILVDLKSGKRMNQYTEINSLYETLSKTREKEKTEGENTFECLYHALREQIQKMAYEMLQEGNLQPWNVFRTLVIGETFLLHLFLNIPPVDAYQRGLYSLFYQTIQLCPQEQVPKMNPWGTYQVLPQWGHMIGSNALAACFVLYEEGREPILMLQPVLQGLTFLQFGKKIWVTEPFHNTPDEALLRTNIGKVVTAAGIQIEEIKKIYVCLPFSQRIPQIEKKIREVFPSSSWEQIHYISEPHWIGAQTVLLAKTRLKKMLEIQNRSVFLMD